MALICFWWCFSCCFDCFGCFSVAFLHWWPALFEYQSMSKAGSRLWTKSKSQSLLCILGRTKDHEQNNSWVWFLLHFFRILQYKKWVLRVLRVSPSPPSRRPYAGASGRSSMREMIQERGSWCRLDRSNWGSVVFFGGDEEGATFFFQKTTCLGWRVHHFFLFWKG